ncbi:unnamed protein product [Pieris macdunnoughi]|uniref:Uncharacterized protein n=1 Tax=Pieris macdunnoughi TaxID=345717 RepID=A0A821WE81_9NEOP|nr:unnamed protein product [Pieris macdunnoughi]
MAHRDHSMEAAGLVGMEGSEEGRVHTVRNNLYKTTGTGHSGRRMAGSKARRTHMDHSTGSSTARMDRSMAHMAGRVGSAVGMMEDKVGKAGRVDTKVVDKVVDTKAVGTDRNRGSRDHKDRNTPFFEFSF